MDRYCLLYLTFIAFVGAQGEISKPIDTDLIVAFKCGHPNVFFYNGVWKKDRGSECLKKPIDILAYCKHVYPAEDIQNIMEMEGLQVVPTWCKKGDATCQRAFADAISYICLTGKFQSEALLVPEPCIFDHLHDSSHCAPSWKWTEIGERSCKERGLATHQHSLLKPCGLNKFTGVEFVCCPSNFEASGDNRTFGNKMNEEKRVEEKANHPEHSRESSRGKIVDAYLNRDTWGDKKGWTEHDFYLKARKDMAKHHKLRVIEMMNDWNSAKLRSAQQQDNDKKEGGKLTKQITERFQKLYEAEEVENEMEKKQLSDLHQQRVTVDLNDRKQKALDHYLGVIDDPNAEATEIIKALKHFIQILHKDRFHTITRFKHLLGTDPAKADSIRESSANHITGLDRQLEETLSLLDRIPKFKGKIHDRIDPYIDSYHSIDASFMVLIDKQNNALRKESSQNVRLEKPSEDDYVVDVGDRSHGTPDNYVTNVEDGFNKFDKPFQKAKNGKEKETKGFHKLDDETVKKLKYGDQMDSFPEMMESKLLKYGQLKNLKDDFKRTTSNSAAESIREDLNVHLDGLISNATPIIQEKQPKVVNVSTAMENVEEKQKLGENDDTSVDDDDDDDDEDEKSEDLREIDVNSIDGDIFDRHFFPNPDHMQKNEINVEQLPKYGKHAPTSIPGPNFGAAIPLGVAVGTLTVAVVIAIGVLVMRRRGNGGLYSNSSSSGGSPGHHEDGLHNASPEERHVANMQMNGYENPTYKYFERYQQNPVEA